MTFTTDQVVTLRDTFSSTGKRQRKGGEVTVLHFLPKGETFDEDVICESYGKKPTDAYFTTIIRPWKEDRVVIKYNDTGKIAVIEEKHFQYFGAETTPAKIAPDEPSTPEPLVKETELDPVLGTEMEKQTPSPTEVVNQLGAESDDIKSGIRRSLQVGQIWEWGKAEMPFRLRIAAVSPTHITPEHPVRTSTESKWAVGGALSVDEFVQCLINREAEVHVPQHE